MTSIAKKLENAFAAVAFAEAGEHETAREIMREQDEDRARETKVDRQAARVQAPGLKR